MAGKRRPLIYAVAGLVLVWVLALAGYQAARHFKVTPEQVAAYARSLDLSKLSAADREKALRSLATKLNGLSPEERRGLRPDRDLFNQMTEDEKGSFIEATMPTQIKQALSVFESLPEDQRQKIINNALKDLRSQTNNLDEGGGNTNRPPDISPELEAKVRTLGLKTFYSQSSAETKAELAPLLNEMQIQMQNGRQFRRGGNQ